MLLRDLLVELEGLDPDTTEVLLATQPSWPFEWNIGGTALVRKPKPLKSDEEVEAMSDEERDRYMEACENGEYVDPAEMPKCDVVYIAEGRQLGYLPGRVKDELGW